MVAWQKTNTTTHFFRESRALEMICANKARRVWCVGCSTGDEPHSLAMLGLEAGAPIEILATDINTEALFLAKRGEYPPRNLHYVEPGRRARWFHGGLQLAQSVRNCVRFAHHDVTCDPPPDTGFDVVLCRHVMVYFSPAEIRRALASIIPSLRPGGMLVLAAAEWLGTELRAQVPECAWLEEDDLERARDCFERAIALLGGADPMREGAFFGTPRVALEAARHHLANLMEGNRRL